MQEKHKRNEQLISKLSNFTASKSVNEINCFVYVSNENHNMKLSNQFKLHENKNK